MSDQSIVLLWDEVRRKTLMLLEGVTPHQARWAPPGLVNSILWHAGHSYVVVEVLCMQALGREPQLPDGWFDMFSWASRPAQVAADRWPLLPEVAIQLRKQHARLRSLFSSLSDEQLTARPAGRRDRTVRYYIVHALHDEACHSGEIWLLRKMQRALHDPV